VGRRGGHDSRVGPRARCRDLAGQSLPVGEMLGVALRDENLKGAKFARRPRDLALGAGNVPEEGLALGGKGRRRGCHGGRVERPGHWMR
jgi:hypothetical protein